MATDKAGEQSAALCEQAKELLGRITPGPWWAFDKNDTVAVMKGKRDEVICWTGFDASHFRENASANAEAIALLPKLLKFAAESSTAEQSPSELEP